MLSLVDFFLNAWNIMKISVTLKGILIIQSYPLLELFLVHMIKKNLTQNEF